MDTDIPESLCILREAIKLIEGAQFEIIDEKSNFLACVRIGEKTYYPSAAKIPVYPLNNSNSAELVNDKAFTNTVLDRHGVTRVDGDYFYAKEDDNKFAMPSIKESVEYAEAIGFPVFVKPNRSSHGFQADFCFDSDAVVALAKEIAKTDYVFHVQKVYSQREFRLFCIDGEIEFAYERFRPEIDGDGRATVRQLIDDINGGAQFDTMRVSLESNFLRSQLELAELELTSILPTGRKLPVSPAANIARGGEIKNVSRPPFDSEVSKLCRKVAEITGLRVMGLDIFADGLDCSARVIEVNHNPSLRGIFSEDKELGLAVWTKILLKWQES